MGQMGSHSGRWRELISLAAVPPVRPLGTTHKEYEEDRVKKPE